MNRQELIEQMKDIFPDPRDAEKAVISVFEIMKSALRKKEKVVISSFGTFTPIEKKPAMRRNPRTSEKVLTGPRKKVRFKPSRKLISEL
ncbi:MAG: integration host factor subunit alpha [Elusimicrobiota bacterium]